MNINSLGLIPTLILAAGSVFLFIYRCTVAATLNKALEFGETYPSTSNISAPGDAKSAGKGPRNLLLQMLGFDKSIQFAVHSKTLQYFNFGQALSPVHRTASRTSGLLRSWAGWLLLLGLIFTLWNLQSAVGRLSSAFDQLSYAPQQIVVDRHDDHARERNVTENMSLMAGQASNAFRYSFVFIILALESGLWAVQLEGQAKRAAAVFEENANSFFQQRLPLSLPATDSEAALRLADSLSPMKDVASELREAADAFRNLQPLVTTMGEATDAIQLAMSQLPEELRSSMTSITSEMISQLTQTLGESTEYTKKILAIYAEQELRVKGLDALVKSTESALAEICGSHKLLENLPERTDQLSQAASSMAEASRQISVSLQELPIEAMTSAANALIEGKVLLAGSSEQLRRAIVRFNPGLSSAPGQQGGEA